MIRYCFARRCLGIAWVTLIFAFLSGAGVDAAYAQKVDPPDAGQAAQRSFAVTISRGQYLIALISMTAVVACVLLHYEVLKWLSRFLAHLKKLHRTRVLILILGLMLIHLIEIWLYAFGYAIVDRRADFGHLQGKLQEGWLDYIYFSFVTYATVGYGDIVPVGPIRFLAAQEALSGVVLIAWSASFTFLEMGRFWREPEK